MLGLTFGTVFLYFVVDSRRHEWGFLRYHTLTPIFAISAAMFLAIIFYIIFLSVEKCICLCKCGPYVKRSGLDIETLEVVDLEEEQLNLHSQFELLLISL